MLPSINNRNNTPPSTDPTSSEANTNQSNASNGGPRTRSRTANLTTLSGLPQNVQQARNTDANIFAPLNAVITTPSRTNTVVRARRPQENDPTTFAAQGPMPIRAEPLQVPAPNEPTVEQRINAWREMGYQLPPTHATFRRKYGEHRLNEDQGAALLDMLQFLQRIGVPDTTFITSLYDYKPTFIKFLNEFNDHRPALEAMENICAAITATGERTQAENTKSFVKSISGMQNRKGMPNADGLNQLWRFCTQNLMSDPCGLLSSITGMQASQGLPDMTELDEFLVFCMTRCPDDPRKMLKSITAMQAKQGIPDLEVLDELWTFCERNGQGNPAGLLSSITGMQNGLGIPDFFELTNLLIYCEDYCVINGLDNHLGLLSSITGMQHKQGIPYHHELDGLLTFCRDFCENNGRDSPLGMLSSITGMQHNKGIPNPNKLRDLLTFCVNNARDNPLGLLSSITGMQHGKGIPNLKTLGNLFTICVNYGQGFPLDLLSSITGMLHAKGIPEDLDELRNLLAFCENNGRGNPSSLLNKIASMQSAKGLPVLGKVRELWDYCQDLFPYVNNNELGATRAHRFLKAIAIKYHAKGVPDVELVNKHVEDASDIGKIKERLGVVAEKLARAWPNLTRDRRSEIIKTSGDAYELARFLT